MATIDDFGQTNEPLSAPVFGGPSGWAAAVRDAINHIQSGYVQMDGSGFGSITFPLPYSSPPTVVATVQASPDVTEPISAMVEGASTTGCTVFVRGEFTAGVFVRWIAVPSTPPAQLPEESQP